MSATADNPDPAPEPAEAPDPDDARRKFALALKVWETGATLLATMTDTGIADEERNPARDAVYDAILSSSRYMRKFLGARS